MFRQQFEIKSNVQIKASERKVVKEAFAKVFLLPPDDLNELFSKKTPVNNVKVQVGDHNIIQVYVINKIPLAFKYEEVLYPTVFLLWRYPNIFYSFTTHENVIKYIKSGADLMLPGLCFPSRSMPLESRYGNVQKGEIVYVNLSSNKAAIAVGVATKSSEDMIKSGGKGKCVNILHFFGDKLSKLDGLSMNYPELGSPFVNEVIEAELPTDQPANEDAKDNIEKMEVCESTVSENEALAKDTDVVSKEEMDKLLNDCFCGAIKYSKTLKLPILTSTFYKVEMLPLCPSNKKLDIKKTSFKKLKNFLDHTQQLGIISVKETSKGVECIISVNKEHEMIRGYYLTPEERPKTATSVEEEHNISVAEKYTVTAAVAPIFLEQGCKKGDALLPLEIKQCVTSYAKNNHLQDMENPRVVKPNDLLSRLCKTKEPVTWERLMEHVLDSMKKCLEVKSGQEEIVTKGETPKILINVVTRSGNKKVTLIDNLELYGINLTDFSKECMHGVAASTSISRPPGKKCDQLMVQGNQVLFIHSLVTDKYKVPKKFVECLVKPPKKKK